MIVRFLLAVTGGVIITGTMLIGMSQFAAMFRERSGDKIFLIYDVLPAPERGRPQRPPPAALPPERAGPERFEQGPTLTVEAPDEPETGVAMTPAAAPPALDAPPPDLAPD